MTDVGHRALVAYERDRDRYDLHYSHWGAHDWRLATAIRPDQPFGRPESEHRGETTAVDPAPLATDCSFDAVLDEHLDFQGYEAFVSVSESFEVTSWLVCWFGLPGVDSDRPRDGAIVSVDTGAVRLDGERLRSRFAGAKETVGAMVDRGDIDPETARASLARAVESWGGNDRPVHLGPTTRAALGR
ncbi:DUF6735 family protein [Halorientalis salina]|uniref:DUF6735 family protein n=1 Tax=Halorientalis salina TaxID=2932266 RepID=UPI0010ABD221|nr:DUF6735 family protein [Halorientalis salina]